MDLSSPPVRRCVFSVSAFLRIYVRFPLIAKITIQAETIGALPCKKSTLPVWQNTVCGAKKRNCFWAGGGKMSHFRVRPKHASTNRCEENRDLVLSQPKSWMPASTGPKCWDFKTLTPTSLNPGELFSKSWIFWPYPGQKDLPSNNHVEDFWPLPLSKILDNHFHFVHKVFRVWLPQLILALDFRTWWPRGYQNPWPARPLRTSFMWNHEHSTVLLSSAKFLQGKVTALIEVQVPSDYQSSRACHLKNSFQNVFNSLSDKFSPWSEAQCMCLHCRHPFMSLPLCHKRIRYFWYLR